MAESFRFIEESTAGRPELFDGGEAEGPWSVVLVAAPPERAPLGLRLDFAAASRRPDVLAVRALGDGVAAFLALVDDDGDAFASALLTHDAGLMVLVLEVVGSVSTTVDELLDVAGGGHPGDAAAWRRLVDLDWVVQRDHLRISVPGGPVLAEGRWGVMGRALGLALRRVPARTPHPRIVGRFGATSTVLLVDRQPPDVHITARWVSETIAFATTVPASELDAVAKWLVG